MSGRCEHVSQVHVFSVLLHVCVSVGWTRERDAVLRVRVPSPPRRASAFSRDERGSGQTRERSSLYSSTRYCGGESAGGVVSLYCMTTIHVSLCMTIFSDLAHCLTSAVFTFDVSRLGAPWLSLYRPGPHKATP